MIVDSLTRIFGPVYRCLSLHHDGPSLLDVLLDDTTPDVASSVLKSPCCFSTSLLQVIRRATRRSITSHQAAATPITNARPTALVCGESQAAAAHGPWKVLTGSNCTADTPHCKFDSLYYSAGPRIAPQHSSPGSLPENLPLLHQEWT